MITDRNRIAAEEEYRGSSILRLITNYKVRRMFNHNIAERQDIRKRTACMKVGEEDYIDLEENEILASMFSEREMGHIIEDLVVETLRLESNLRIAARWLTSSEANILELAAKGYSSQQIYSKTGLQLSEIALSKETICEKLNQGNFAEAIDFIRQKQLQQA